MTSLKRVVQSLFISVGAVGSLFVKKTSNGKYEIAIAPLVIVMAIGSGVTCAVQRDEPFRTCVKNNIDMLQEVVNAN